jgi:hypothetical protein
MSTLPFNLVLHAFVLLIFGCFMLAMTRSPWFIVSLIVHGSPSMYYWDFQGKLHNRCNHGKLGKNLVGFLWLT